MSIALSFRTEEATRDKLDKIAAANDRNRNWVINEAIAAYVDLYQWQLEEIDKGIADTDAGRSYSLEDVRAHFAGKQRIPKAKK